jgi:hypothetical protein
MAKKADEDEDEYNRAADKLTMGNLVSDRLRGHRRDAAKYFVRALEANDTGESRMLLKMIIERGIIPVDKDGGRLVDIAAAFYSKGPTLHHRKIAFAYSSRQLNDLIRCVYKKTPFVAVAEFTVKAL